MLSEFNPVLTFARCFSEFHFSIIIIIVAGSINGPLLLRSYLKTYTRPSSVFTRVFITKIHTNVVVSREGNF
jgi:hypothetical protein